MTELVKTTVPYEKCEALMDSGSKQCMYMKASGSRFCIIHGGKNIEAKNKMKNYRLERYRQRVTELSDSDAIKSLREEIGILRMVMEEIVNKCQDSNDILMYSQKINETAMNINKLVNSCHKLESSLEFLMDKTSVLNISTQLINIVNNHITDETVLDLIVEEVDQLIS